MAKRPEGIPAALNFTDSKIADLPLTVEGQYQVRDSGCPGLWVTIGKARRTYSHVANYREQGVKRKKRTTIGPADEVDVKEARKEAARLTADVLDGKKQSLRREAITLGQAWEAKKAAMLAQGKRPKSIRNHQDDMDGPLKDWHDVRLRDLARNRDRVPAKLEAILQKHGMWTEKRCRSTIRGVYNFAQERGLDPALPEIKIVRGAPKYSKRQLKPRQDYALTDETFAVRGDHWRRIENPVRREFHLMLLLSGYRENALKQAKWADLDVRGRVLRLPEGKEDTDTIVLSRPMLAALARVRRAGRAMHPKAAKTWIFPADSATGYLNTSKEHVKIPREDGTVERVLLKGPTKTGRQTLNTRGLAAGLTLEQVQMLACHATGSITDKYLRPDTARADLIEAQGKLSAHLCERLGLTDWRRPWVYPPVPKRVRQSKKKQAAGTGAKSRPARPRAAKAA